MTNEERQPSPIVDDTFNRASDVNTDPPGSRWRPAGSGDRDEAAIRNSYEKLAYAGGGE